MTETFDQISPMLIEIEQIQKENRRFILEAIHGVSYDEALQKELGVGCKVKVKSFISTQDFNKETLVIDNYCDFFDESFFKTIDSRHTKEIIEIIGKPLTLNRVLKGIDPFGNYGCIAGHICKVNRKEATYAFICEWNLELETLEEQSEETQRVINQLLTGE